MNLTGLKSLDLSHNSLVSLEVSFGVFLKGKCIAVSSSGKYIHSETCVLCDSDALVLVNRTRSSECSAVIFLVYSELVSYTSHCVFKLL